MKIFNPNAVTYCFDSLHELATELRAKADALRKQADLLEKNGKPKVRVREIRSEAYGIEQAARIVSLTSLKPSKAAEIVGEAL